MKKRIKNKFYKTNSKRGISLITLVITIIVIIILAAAIVMSLNNNNIITNASKARYDTDRDTMQSVLEITIQKVVLRHQSGIELISGSVNEKAKDVLRTKGEIRWVSEQNANLSGKIVFGEGEDTDTVFYTGEELPVYGSETTWYLDEDKKLSLKVGALEMGGTIYEEYEVDKIEVPEIKEFSWHIYTCEQLKFLADFVNNGNALTEKQREFVLNEGYNEADIVLTADTVVYLEKDLDFGAREIGEEWKTVENESKKWIPIGKEKTKQMNATFEGNNHVIKGVYVNQEEDFAGIFGNSNTIKNLIVKDSYIKGGEKCTGGIVGALRSGELTNCHNINTKIIGKDYVGGVAGQAQCTTSGCTNKGSEIEGMNKVGGIVGMGMNIKQCENKGIVNGKIFVGGVIGNLNVGDTISDCNNSGKVIGIGERIGGIVGNANSQSIIIKCFNTGEVEGELYTGGIVGLGSVDSNKVSECRIEECYNIGTISGNNEYVGGIIGSFGPLSQISSCYNTGTITGRSKAVGGIVGNGESGEISNCYNSGNINGNIEVGGIIGLLDGQQGTATNCYNKGNIIGTSRCGEVVGYQTGLNTLNNLYYLNTVGIGAIDGVDDEANNIIGIAEDITSYEEFLTWIENK